MSLIEQSSSPVVLRLNRDLVRTIKRGHPWVYADALREVPSAPAGSPALLLDNRKGQPVAWGFFDPACPVAFRVCETDPEVKLDDRWAKRRLSETLWRRRGLTLDGRTTGYRLMNGEGDGLPGLVVDVYGDVAVVKMDGDGPAAFWQGDTIGLWLAEECHLSCVYERQKERGAKGRLLTGSLANQPVRFLEHGLTFTADIVSGQKTGFFLDQRENRQFVRSWSREARVLNVFSYTGGFSVAAGAGAATHVTSVDLAPAAIEAANRHWELNGLDKSRHAGVVADAFEFLEQATRERQKWNVVILDPPSFAPNQESVPKALNAYRKVIEAGTRTVARSGVLAVASCSSHITLPMFLECCEESISNARRRGIVLQIAGQPADHPTPLALPEFRYLKFVVLQLD